MLLRDRFWLWGHPEGKYYKEYKESFCTAVNFKGAKYTIYFNPIIFLSLNIKQMETTIKHEILHILSLHLLRGRELKNKYSKLWKNKRL